MHTDQLRVLVNEVARDLAQLPRGGAYGDADHLSLSWKRLVDFMDLGPPPEERACPHCGTVGMRAATRCGHCWTKLLPPAPGTGLRPGAGVPAAFSDRAP